MPARITALAAVAGVLLLALGPAAEARAAKTPDWVERPGVSAAHPTARFLVGFGEARGREDAIEQAKQQAAADLARQISVQIEASVVDVARERKGRLEQDLTSRIRATSDIRLEGIRFETHRTRRQAWALAVIERAPAAAARRRARDRALTMTARCLDEATQAEAAGRSGRALEIYRSCRTPLDEAIEHEAIAAGLQRGGLLGDDVADTLAAHASRIATRVRAIPHEDARSIRAAADALSAQLARGGLGRGARVEVAPLLYQGRDVSSPFGREIALALESAIGRSTARGPDPARAQGRDLPVATARGADAIVVRGSYREQGEDFQLRVNARETGTGRLLASAEIDLAGEAVPEGLATRPANFDRFAADADKLFGGDVVSGDLRVELRTDRGLRGLVYEEGEEMRILVRVNQPAWIRLIYVLTSGEHVPLTQAWYIDEGHVNQLVEYPVSFEVVAPYGVEMIHAMASTERPPALRTARTVIGGEPYEVIPRGADQVVRTRGLARKQKRQVAEQTLQVTTLPGRVRSPGTGLRGTP